MEANIKKHETSSLYEVDGRTFVINAFDPILGNFILVQLFTFVLPLGIGKALNENLGTEMIPVDVSNAKMMTKSDFMQLERDILSSVYEKFQSGQVSPVVRENGTYGIDGVSMSLFIRLMIASLAFNFKDFFKDVPSLEKFMSL